MRRVFLAMAVISLVGCMAPTMNEARQDGPSATLRSQKAPADVAACVQSEWQNQKLFGVTPGATLQPSKPDGYTVFTFASEYFADMAPAGSGAEIKFYAVVNNWIAERRLQALKACL